MRGEGSRGRAGLVVALMVVGCAKPPLASQEQEGRWTPKILSAGAAEYLPDFSYAGYREGEARLPHGAVTHRVRDFGAVPGDGKDDTAAFRVALSELAHVSGPVVLALEPGRYVLSDVLFFERADFVLRGAGSGPDGSVLELRRPLADLPRAPVIQELEQYLQKNDKRVEGKPFSPFSWTGGLLWTRLPTTPATFVGAHAIEGRRGGHTLRVSSSALAAGALIELRWFNPFGPSSPVLQHLFGLPGAIPGERLADATQVLTSQTLTVERREGDQLWLKEPLRHDVRPEWGAELGSAAPRLEGVGFEQLRVELPSEPYAGHHLERGYNAFYLNDLRHGFLRDVVIENADSAILSDSCDHLTFSDIQVTGRGGHYGIHLGDVEDVLVQGFSIQAPSEHSLSFNTGARGSVFTRGSIVIPRLDQHRGRNHQNLFDDIDTSDPGPGSALFEHGGADYWGPTAGAFNTFWNISLHVQHPGAPPLLLTGVTDAGPARLIGLHANLALRIDYPRAYVEGSDRADIGVPSLYSQQLSRRLAQGGSLPQTSSPPR